MNSLSGIYCIENKINGKKYVGQSLDVHYRMNRNHRDSPALNNAIKTYGLDNFDIYMFWNIVLKID